MTLLPPLPDDAPRPLYSIVAWPPEVLDSWLRRLQDRLNVRGFGLPHLNIRAPFQTPLRSAELLDACRTALRGQSAFEVQVLGWKQLPGVIFLECGLSPELRALHDRTLEIGPSSRARYDGAEYRPHLTLALGVLPWAEPVLGEAIRDLRPPLTSFRVEALSLTREHRGEVQELHTFPLLHPASETEPERRDAEAAPS
ncbi:2'-5' RNA ligase family protein [Deinococcus taeanensis]|uniref:2'-5' RNA ligase family protein n=1 Tax=Deinococcus taeanensis TaxID=2737050 RepID=UPI001CDCD797|nr:2'-5' RNA ligase family protein [Deinococcus taeanensis]UBV41847.1 2'-5' RNA ligase family protein [Deinococcus taeanensis]